MKNIDLCIALNEREKKKAYCLSDVPNVVATFSYLPATFSLIAPKQHSMEFLHPIPPRASEKYD